MANNNLAQTVKRFTKTFIMSHWIYAGSFFGLLLTGLPMWTETFDFLYTIFGGPATARTLHRVLSIIFMLPPIVLILFDRPTLYHWAKQVTSWKKHDFQFFLGFPKELFGKHADIPKQDFYNAGEKLNSLLQVFTFGLLVFSGFMMWFPQFFPAGLQMWGYPLHDIGFGLSLAVVIGHIYLSVGHPNSRVSIKGMTKGEVPLSYAKDHHGRWYDELTQKQ